MTVVIVDGIRSPFGNFGGSFKEMSPVSMGSKVLKGLFEKLKYSPEDVDDIIVGNVIQTEPDSIYVARHIGLNAGMRVAAPALTVNRLCGSGMEAVVQAYYSIKIRGSKSVIAGGVENMSRSPYLVMGARWGNRLGNNEIVDMLHTGLTDGFVNMSMGLTAENLATEYKISRESQDEWARLSQARAEKARDNGILAEEILPFRVRTDKGRGEIKEDETIRGTAASEKISNLPAAFRSDGTVTAGNSSGLNDGASMLLVMDEQHAKEKGLKPLARIRGFGISGCDPKLMGLGPVHAIPLALKMAGLELKDMGLIEINEAFAAQILAVKQALDLNPEILNVNGGAIAIGHPLGASGNRLLLTMAKEMRRRNVQFGVASLCIGGGQGIAAVIENIP
jgi:acetyl-CoA acetyltransferase family protein